MIRSQLTSSHREHYDLVRWKEGEGEGCVSCVCMCVCVRACVCVKGGWVT